MRASLKPLVAVALVAAMSLSGAERASYPPLDERSLAATLVPDEPTTTSTAKPVATPATTTSTTAATTTTALAAAGPPAAAAVPPAAAAAAPPPPVPVAAPPGTPAPAPPLPAALPLTPAPARDLTPYRGLGTWVDAYDFSPEFQSSGTPPRVTLASVDHMAAEGVKTLYLQAAKDDVRSPGLLVNPEILGPMLVRAHTHGMKVVAWYLPKFYDLDSDMRRLIAMRDFRFSGHGFDGIGLDIEWRRDVPDHAERNPRLVELSRRLREAMGGAAVAAITPSVVLMEVVNPRFWPAFPWQELVPYYDVWMPMGYWTFRTQRSGYRDGYRYTEENLRRLRANLGLPDAPVHALGGTDNRSTDEDYRGFVRAAHEQRAIGGSIYDYDTTPAHAWEILRGVPQ